MQSVLLSVLDNLAPGDGSDIAASQPCIAGKEKGLFDMWIWAVCLFKLLDLLSGQVLTLALGRLDFILRRQLHDGIVGNDILAHGHIEGIAQASEIVDDRIVFQFLAPRRTIVIAKEVGQPNNIVPVHVPHGNIDIVCSERMDGIVDEFLVFDSFLLLCLTECLHPVLQQHFSPDGCILQSCLVVGDFKNTVELDSVGGTHSVFILYLCLRIGLWNEVEFQKIITALAVHIDVEIERAHAIGKFFLPESYRLLGVLCGCLSCHICYKFLSISSMESSIVLLMIFAYRWV